MDRSLLVTLVGFPATLIHGDTLVYDRWRWLRRRLPKTRNGETVVDLGCGTGAFSIGAAKRGYHVLGIGWDESSMDLATHRAALCSVSNVKFDALDLRALHTRADLVGAFDAAICTECVEHIIDDFKLFRDIAKCLAPGGRLLLTTPHLYYHAITAPDEGPFELVDSRGQAFTIPADKPAIALCRCGHSARKPFCDGSHKTSGFVSDEAPPPSTG